MDSYGTVISSSTGTVNDSIPPTPPVDLHGDGDLSVPSPNPVLNRQARSHHIQDVDDMIDSTVDSSGYSNLDQHHQSSMEGHPSGSHVHHHEEGPVQSSHYEDSSDDDDEAVGVHCDDGRLMRPHYSRNNSSNNTSGSAMESGISTSGQVDEGQFRLVPNNVEDERFNQFNPPRSQPEPSASSSSSTASTSRASASHHHHHPNEAAINNAAAAEQPLFCEPGSSRPRNNGNISL